MTYPNCLHSCGVAPWTVVVIAVIVVAICWCLRYAADEVHDLCLDWRDRWRQAREARYDQPVQDATDDPESCECDPASSYLCEGCSQAIADHVVACHPACVLAGDHQPPDDCRADTGGALARPGGWTPDRSDA